MNGSRVLFDLPGPRARRRQRLGSIAGLVLVLLLVGVAVWRLGVNGQLEPERWAILFDPSTNVPQRLLAALVDTLQVAAVGMVAATVLGGLLAVGRLSEHRLVRIPVVTVIEFFRAVPLLVLILFCLLFLPQVGVRLGPFGALALGLTLYNMAVLAEVIRAGILSVDRGQSESAYALGMRKWQVMSFVLVPQAVRRMLPLLVAQLVVLLKDSSLGLIVAYPELLRTARSLVETLNFQFGPRYTFQLYVAAGLIYIIVNVLLSQLAKYIERRTNQNAKTAGTTTLELPADSSAVSGLAVRGSV